MEENQKIEIKERDPREVKENEVEAQFYYSAKRGFFFSSRTDRIPESEVFGDDEHSEFKITGNGISRLHFLAINGSAMNVYVAAKKDVDKEGKENEATAIRIYVLEDGNKKTVKINGDKASFDDIKTVTKLFSHSQNPFDEAKEYIASKNGSGFVFVD